MTATGGAPKASAGFVAASWALNVVGVLIGVWAVLEYGPFPTSAITCVSVAALTVILALVFPSRFGLFGARRPGVLGLATLFLAPLIGLIVAASFGVKLLHLSSDLVPALVGAAGGGAGGALWWLRFRGAWVGSVAMAMLGVLVACAFFEELDVRLDRGAAQLFKVPVTDMSVTHGRRSTSYFVDLPPWGPNKEADSVEVSPDVYDNIAPGQIVCVVLHPGYFNARWFLLDVCPTPVTAPAS